MKVGLLTARMSHAGGGVSDAVARLARSLQATQGCDVAIVGLADHGRTDTSINSSGVPTTALPTCGPSSWGYAPELNACLGAANLDLLHVHGLWMYPSVASLSWAQETGRPYMVAPHGMLDRWAMQNSAWKKKLALLAFERRHLSGAACLHALCEAEAQSIRALGLKNPICIIPNSIEQPVSARQDRRHKFPKILLSLGRLHPKKGLDSLLRAWQLFESRCDLQHEGWQLVIAGWDQGDHGQELRELAAELGIVGSVRFVGPKFGTDKERLFRDASCFILPSLSEGLPLVVLEAWSHALPVLMTRYCNLPVGFSSGAALSIGANSEGILRGLSKMAAMNDAEREAMGLRGLDLCSEHFSFQKTATMMNEVYRWLLGQAPRPYCVHVD
jgi:glycosyltransferase involved in cell wall biosynthesis